MNGSLLLGTIGQTARIEKDKLFPLETGGRIEGCSQVTSWSDELLLMRGFGGVFLLTKQGNKWRMVSNPVEEGTVKRAEFESAHILWILDIHDLTRLVLSQDLTTIVSKQSFCQVGGLSCEKVLSSFVGWDNVSALMIKAYMLLIPRDNRWYGMNCYLKLSTLQNPY